MDVREFSIIYHVGIVLAVLLICSSFNYTHPILYLLSLVYLYQVHELYIIRLRKKLQFEERKQANQKRVLSDSETVRWLNHAVERIWPVCMEQIASQKVLLPIIPWFLDKYKPWTAKEAEVQHLYLGRTPPVFTEMRVLRQSTDDDHLVMELGMNFLTADDMNAILAVKLRRRLGFGMWAKLHVTGMHVEGKVLIGVKFLPKWPFVGRMRICFVEPPYFQMTVKPIISHGLDVTELPGIAGWLDKLLSVAFEQTLVEPNMLVVDMEKFASESKESWFTVDEKAPIAYVKVEVMEAADMKPSDPNGLADPYVKGQLGPYRFRTKTQKKTLTPKWQEEFKIPICTWETPNVLAFEVRDKDYIVDDTLGNCSINVTDVKEGKRHDMWLPLQNIKMGRLHVAVTVLDVNGKEQDGMHDANSLNVNESTYTIPSETAKDVSNSNAVSKEAPMTMDDFEPINVEGQQRTGIWVQHPGSDVSHSWEPKKRNRQADIKIQREDKYSMDSPSSATSDQSDEIPEGNRSKFKRGLKKIGSVFHRNSRTDDTNFSGEIMSPRNVNIRAVNEKGTSLNIIRDADTSGIGIIDSKAVDCLSPESNEPLTPGKVKAMKSILKQAEHGLKHALSRKGSRKSDRSNGAENQQDSDSSESSQSSHYKHTPRDNTTEFAPVFDDGVKPLSPQGLSGQVSPCDSARFEEPTVKSVSFEGVQDKARPDIQNTSQRVLDASHEEDAPKAD